MNKVQELGEDYWEMEDVIGRRVGKAKSTKIKPVVKKHKSRQGHGIETNVEYLVKWRGCKESESTWEPSDNLCDTGFQAALMFEQRFKEDTETTTKKAGNKVGYNKKNIKKRKSLDCKMDNKKGDTDNILGTKRIRKKRRATSG